MNIYKFTYMSEYLQCLFLRFIIYEPDMIIIFLDNNFILETWLERVEILSWEQ